MYEDQSYVVRGSVVCVKEEKSVREERGIYIYTTQSRYSHCIFIPFRFYRYTLSRCRAEHVDILGG